MLFSDIAFASQFLADYYSEQNKILSETSKLSSELKDSSKTRVPLQDQTIEPVPMISKILQNYTPGKNKKQADNANASSSSASQQSRVNTAAAGSRSDLKEKVEPKDSTIKKGTSTMIKRNLKAVNINEKEYSEGLLKTYFNNPDNEIDERDVESDTTESDSSEDNEQDCSKKAKSKFHFIIVFCSKIKGTMYFTESVKTEPVAKKAKKLNKTDIVTKDWTDQQIKLLIALYKQHINLIGVDSKGFWKKIVAGMNEKGHNFNNNECSKKMDALKSLYKTSKDHNNRTGNNPKYCVYYDVIILLFY